MNIPTELVCMILEFDGRIKYRKGKYVNIIHKHDTRYTMLKKIIEKKINILNKVLTDGNGFNFTVSFNIDNKIGLCYDYNYSNPDTFEFEICYFDFRNEYIKQIRTYL